MAKLISYKSWLNKQLEDPEFADEYAKARIEVRFAVSLAMLREKRGLTQTQLGELVGAKQPMIARYERGQIPNVVMLQKLTYALDAVFTMKPDGSVVFEPAEAQAERLAA